MCKVQDSEGQVKCLKLADVLNKIFKGKIKYSKKNVKIYKINVKIFKKYIYI